MIEVAVVVMEVVVIGVARMNVSVVVVVGDDVRLR